MITARQLAAMMVMGGLAALPACTTINGLMQPAALDEVAPTRLASAPVSAAAPDSETDARRLIEAQGYTKVTGLYRDDSAIWRAVATKAGRTGEVAVNTEGRVIGN